MSTLYISDLDGTLLRDDGTLSDFSKHTLTGLLQDGLYFTVASARSVVSMRQILDGLELFLPIIEFNGAFISDLKSGRHEIIHNIEPLIVENIYELIRKFNCAPFISSFNGSEDCAYYKDILNEGMRWYLDDRLANNDKRFRTIEHLPDSFGDQIVCLTVIGPADVLLELEHAINEMYGKHVDTHNFENQYSPGWYWLTIHDHRATKDQGIRTLKRTCGLNGEVVVFGDHNNDIKMFQHADRALAVANATAELKRHATHLIGPNESDSVVKFIQSDWAKKRD